MLRKVGWNHCGEPRTSSYVFQTLSSKTVCEEKRVTKLPFCENGPGGHRKNRKGNSLKAARPFRG